MTVGEFARYQRKAVAMLDDVIHRINAGIDSLNEVDDFDGDVEEIVYWLEASAEDVASHKDTISMMENVGL